MKNQTKKSAKGRLRNSYISSIISISLVLFTLGILGLLVISSQKLSDYMKENIGFTIYLNDSVSNADANYLKKLLDASTYVRSSQYYSKEDAASLMEKELGEDFISYLGYNPLSAFIDVRLKADYANNDSIPKIESWLKQFQQVKEVDYQKSLVNLVNENVSRLGLVVLAFGALMLFIALVLINNTIRLSVYSRRFLINTMKQVGATWGFIRKPFLLRSILHGLYASIIAIGLLSGLIYGIRNEVADILQIVEPYYIMGIFAAVTLVGIAINLTATLLAVNKFLRLNADDLYY
ncbi:MAG: permease-like cell division protein FtsX [Bacteroidales bacterium]|nr:permease-like cell division protein FtsX [Bacteroidales bacterium]HOA10645.1 permease-like cell division protein FtsX [Tenuifilaceae bacterium]MBP8644400.1 permease-like cell division protein FtsX [Bacteroidales bacterium]NLI88138.1 cell division protein FtsX [Bacteroidales bacterium]HOC37015.1 permease-like cell division protein FtsX [Tenuifilaceae bacterium]